MKYRNIIKRIHKDEQYYGWHHLESILYGSLPRSESGVDLDCFLDSYVWSPGQKPHQHPWIGIVHASESGHSLTIGRVMSSPNVVKSLPFCVALVTMSQAARDCLASMVKVPVLNTHHPKRATIFFDRDAYFNRPILRHIGFHARNIRMFKEFKTSLAKVISWRGSIERSPGVEYESATKDKDSYIRDLVSSVGFCYLDGASANNSVLEHIVSHTPIVVNRLPSVEEYIGSEYPMYYENIKDDPDRFLLSECFIDEASSYLNERSKMKIFEEQNFLNFFCAIK